MNEAGIPLLWVVVVTYNASQWIKPCLESISSSSVPAGVIVVDNCSTDETVALMEEAFPDVHLIINKVNRGFGVANNQGMAYAQARGAAFIALLNQDARLEKDCMKNLLLTAENNPDYGVLAPMFYAYEGTGLDMFLLEYIYPAYPALASDMFFGRAREVYEVSLMPAAMWLIRKEALEQVGGFDPLFFMYGEDDDLWRRFEWHGWKAGLAPAATVYHYYPESKIYARRKQEWKAYARYLLLLKSKEESFIKNYFNCWRRLLVTTFNALVFPDFRNLSVSWQAFLKVTARLGSIRRHRQMNLIKNGAFLPPPVSGSMHPKSNRVLAISYP